MSFDEVLEGHSWTIRRKLAAVLYEAEADGVPLDVDTLAYVGSHFAAVGVVEIDPTMDELLVEHCRRFVEWMYRVDRRRQERLGRRLFCRNFVRERFGITDLYPHAQLRAFASPWINGGVKPADQLERFNSLCLALNDDGVTGDELREILLIGEGTVWRAFKGADRAAFKDLPMSYHSDCLATSGVPSTQSFGDGTPITIAAPVCAFPMILFAGAGRERESEFALLDANLRVAGAQLHTVWGEGETQQTL